MNAKFNESQNINAVTLPETIDVFFEDLSLTLGGKTIIDHFSFKFENGKKYLISWAEWFRKELTVPSAEKMVPQLYWHYTNQRNQY